MSVREELLRAADEIERNDGRWLDLEYGTPAVQAVIEQALVPAPYFGVAELRQAAKDQYRGGILAWLS